MTIELRNFPNRETDSRAEAIAFPFPSFQNTLVVTTANIVYRIIETTIRD
jgi:hypothetical protein